MIRLAVDPIIKQKAEDIRHKIYGKEVRESLASGLEAMSDDVVEVTDRQATVEEQFQAVIDETTGKDVISAPEVILARDGATSLGDRLDSDKAEVTAQLAQTDTRLNDNFITIDEMGGVGDYHLPDGTINPNPTDNSDIIENIYAQGHKNVRFNKGDYFFSRPINLPKSGHMDLNACALYFAGDGVNLGNHVWNKVRVYNGSIFGIPVGDTMFGRGLYTDDGYIVYGQLVDLTIRFFKEGTKFISQDDNAQFAWSTLDLVVENCDTGVYFEGGWANAVLTKKLIINFTRDEALFLNNVNQIHEFKMQKLVVESCATNSLINKSPVHFKNCGNGEIIIDSGYFEHNGFSREPQQDEVENFKLNGTKISEESQSWLFGEYVYSEDTNRITKQNLGYHSNFFYENCVFTLITRMNNAYFGTDLYGIASFYSSPNVAVYIDGIRLVNKGFSFPNIRPLFKSNLTNNRVHGKGLSLEGGSPSIINYGEVRFFGDKFSRYGVTETNKHLTVTRASQSIIPPSKTLDINFTSVLEGEPTFARRTSEGTITVQEDGIYTLMLRFVSLATYPDSMTTITFNATTVNSTSVIIPQMIGGVKNTAYAMMKLKKGDTLKVQAKHTYAEDLTIQGANNNTFDFMIIKNIDI